MCIQFSRNNQPVSLAVSKLYIFLVFSFTAWDYGFTHRLTPGLQFIDEFGQKLNQKQEFFLDSFLDSRFIWRHFTEN